MRQPTQCAYIGAGEGMLRSPRPLAADRIRRVHRVMVRPVAGHLRRGAVPEHGAGGVGRVRGNAVIVDTVGARPADGAPTVLRDNRQAGQGVALVRLEGRSAFRLA